MLTILTFIAVNWHVTVLGGYSSRTVRRFHVSPSARITEYSSSKLSGCWHLEKYQCPKLCKDFLTSPTDPPLIQNFVQRSETFTKKNILKSSALWSFCQAAQTLRLPLCDGESCSSYWPETHRRRTQFESHSHLAWANVVKFVLGPVTTVFFLLVTTAARERHDVTLHLQRRQFSSPSTRPRKTAWQWSQPTTKQHRTNCGLSAAGEVKQFRILWTSILLCAWGGVPICF